MQATAGGQARKSGFGHWFSRPYRPRTLLAIVGCDACPESAYIYGSFAYYGEGLSFMGKLAGKLGLVTVCAMFSLSAAAAATVTFINPEKMTDVPRFSSDRESMEMILRDHLNQLAAQLPTGQELKVEFIDIDLAGDVFPRVPVRDIRVMKGQADWPRMHLRYSIEQDGKVLRSGDRELSDPNYLMGSRSYNQDLYGHDKQMLDDWFRKEIMPAR